MPRSCLSCVLLGTTRDHFYSSFATIVVVVAWVNEEARIVSTRRILPNFHIRLEMGSEAQGEDLQRAIDDALQGMDEGEGQRLTESATSQRLQRRVAEEEAKEDRVLIEGLKELRRLRETVGCKIISSL